MSEWDPSIAALIAQWRRCAQGCTAMFLHPQAMILNQCANELESAASALTSHVWDRNAPTVPYLGQMLPQDIDVARTFNESSDPRAMLAFIKLLAVGRPHRIQEAAASALRGVRVTTDQDHDSTRVDGFPEVEHGDLPRRLDGDK